MKKELNTLPLSAKTVVLVSVDGLRADRVRQETMPNLYQLLRRGILFERAYTNSPYTPAAHSTMLTSLYACNHGKTDQSWVLSSHIRSIAQLVEERGGATSAVVSATPMLKERSGFDRGFHIYLQDDRPHNPLMWQWIRLCDAWLRRGLPDLPLMAKPYLKAPYVLREATKLLQADVRSSERQFSFIHLMDLHDPRNLRQVGQRNYSLLDATRVMRRYYNNRYDYNEAYFDEKDVEIYTAIYDANVRMMDEVLGSFVLQWLDLDATVIITSDHGETAYERVTHDTGKPYPGKTLTLYEPEVHVPLVVLDKRIQGPLSVKNAVSLVDLPPTIADLLQVEGDPQFQGMPVWERNLSSPVFMERLDWYARKEAAWLRWPWKLIITPGLLSADEKISMDTHVIELYDLESDPEESRNLYREAREVGQDLAQELREFLAQQTDYWRVCHQESSGGEGDAQIRDRLRMLGYIE
jgi:arylsulfatase A-like enzyme